MEARSVNYYKRHLGDFSRDTAHLSQGQIGAYDLMLDWYYANEKPLPADPEDVMLMTLEHDQAVGAGRLRRQIAARFHLDADDFGADGNGRQQDQQQRPQDHRCLP